MRSCRARSSRELNRTLVNLQALRNKNKTDPPSLLERIRLIFISLCDRHPTSGISCRMQRLIRGSLSADGEGLWYGCRTKRQCLRLTKLVCRPKRQCLYIIRNQHPSNLRHKLQHPAALPCHYIFINSLFLFIKTVDFTPEVTYTISVGKKYVIRVIRFTYLSNHKERIHFDGKND